MTNHNLAFLGFGNVGKAFVRLLERKSDELRDRFGIEWRITGVASRRLGWLANRQGFDPRALLGGDAVGLAAAAADLHDWLTAAAPDALFEITSLNPTTGQPAIDHIRAALDAGAHAITANKGPVVHAYRELRDLAAARGRRFLFESTVMDGAPIFSLFRSALPAANVLGFRGILNSTTNFILTEMEAGRSFDDAVKRAQAIGIAETDPSADIDGWDAAVKVCALAAVLMDAPIKPAEVQPQGIRHLTGDEVRRARQAGRPWKLICSAERAGDGVVARVRPEVLDLSDPLSAVSGTSSAIQFRTDTLKQITLVETDPGPEQTAYGLLADFVNALRGA